MVKDSGVTLLAALMFSLLQLGASHSWLVCADYVPATKQCRGYPRNWFKKPSMPFASDVGRDNRPRNDVPAGLICDQRHEAITSPPSAAYNSGAPMSKVAAGQKITMTWPAKNHATVGTQRGVQIFISKTPNGGDDFSHISSKSAWVSKYPELDKTFSNCEPNAGGVDAAFCSGEFTVPKDLKPGVYTFMWWWEFNGGEFYNSCADVEIHAGSPPTPPPPTPPAPCSSLRAMGLIPPKVQSTFSIKMNKSSTCPGDGNDCSIDHGCCETGKKCYYKGNYRAGCLTKCPGPGYMNPDDPPDQQTPWECTDFSPAPAPSPKKRVSANGIVTIMSGGGDCIEDEPDNNGDSRRRSPTRRRREQTRRRRADRRRRTSRRRRDPPTEAPKLGDDRRRRNERRRSERRRRRRG